jgi:TRAP-type mannitol/chloroaromatic compound transport system substrate-binding protein
MAGISLCICGQALLRPGLDAKKQNSNMRASTGNPLINSRLSKLGEIGVVQVRVKLSPRGDAESEWFQESLKKQKDVDGLWLSSDGDSVNLGTGIRARISR